MSLRISHFNYKVWALGIASALVVIFVLGFVVFATFVMRTLPDIPKQADGIVVLTGGPERIITAARLLREGRAKWMLISGVNRQTSKADILRLSKLDPKLFACCVTLGYIAQNTRGNAIEARNWQRGNSFKSLIIVTAAYHMPRSLIELYRRMPDVKLIPYSVMPKRLRNQSWWLQGDSVRLLAYEYIKFLPSVAEFAVTWIFVSDAEDLNEKNFVRVHHSGPSLVEPSESRFGKIETVSRSKDGGHAEHIQR